ncbi:MAG: glycosyltransferase, partial [Actinomycetota bacterium]|nr:glycosyltransferase [Actinomycetota bacterium]
MTPTCTVVIPTHRRPARLRECLAALADLDYPRAALDVVVVGDFAGERPVAPPGLDVAFFPYAELLPAARRNEGARRARGELIVFVDDDCQPARDWLRLLVDAWQENPGAALGGHTWNTLRSNPYAEASQLVINIGYRQNGEEPNAARFFTTDNLLVPRADFLDLGGFDESFWTAEDREFCDRWMASGRRMAYVPDAIVWHAHPIGLRGFLKRNWHYGRGAQRYWRKRAAAGREPFRPDPEFYATVARAPWRQPAMRKRLTLLLSTWHLLNTAGFVYEAMLARIGRSPGVARAVPYSAETGDG